MTPIKGHPHHDTMREWYPGVWGPTPPMKFKGSPKEQEERERHCINSGGHYLHPGVSLTNPRRGVIFCCWCGYDTENEPGLWARIKKAIKEHL